jgi:hypothetical protein
MGFLFIFQLVRPIGKTRNQLTDMLLVVERSKEPEWEGQVRSLPWEERYALLSFPLYTAKAICLVKVDFEYVDLTSSQRVCTLARRARGNNVPPYRVSSSL